MLLACNKETVKVVAGVERPTHDIAAARSFIQHRAQQVPQLPLLLGLVPLGGLRSGLGASADRTAAACGVLEISHLQISSWYRSEK